MSFRKLLFALGVLFVLAGIGMSSAWLRQMQAPRISGQHEAPRPARLVALHDLPTGTLLRMENFGWKEITPGQLPISGMMRGQANESDYLGAVTRRPFVAGEPLVASELVKPGDKRFLAAVLRPNHRAVSIAVDAAQTSSGLLLAGDFVDVILIQNFGDNVAKSGRRSVAETVLRNIRIVAVDHALGPQTKTTADGAVIAVEARIPKTVTLEVTEQEGHALFVATQLGKTYFAIRALAGSQTAEQEKNAPVLATWAADISPVLRDLAERQALLKLFSALFKERASGLSTLGMARQKHPGPGTKPSGAICTAPNSNIVTNVRLAPGQGCFW